MRDARLNRHEAKELSEKRDEHDRDQDGCDVFDHDTPRCTPTELRRSHDLFLDDLWLDAPTNEDIGQERYDRHHDSVRDEVEEVEQSVRAASAYKSKTTKIPSTRPEPSLKECRLN